MTPFKNISGIDTNTREGRYLMAALAMITSESRRTEEPDKVLGDVYILQEMMYKEATPIPEETDPPIRNFEKELTWLLNSYSKDSESHTPDFLLSSYLKACLDNFNVITKGRDEWFGIKPFPETMEKK